MTGTAARPRITNAGVTLVEMLVVLALFAVVSGAVVMALPTRQTSLSSEFSAAGLAADIERAVDVALAKGEGFAIAVAGDEVRFLQPSADGAWRAHSDPLLEQVKLFSSDVRLSDQKSAASTIFAVSPALVPDQSQPLRLHFGGKGAGSVLTYDGTAVRVEQGEGR